MANVAGKARHDFIGPLQTVYYPIIVDLNEQVHAYPHKTKRSLATQKVPGHRIKSK